MARDFYWLKLPDNFFRDKAIKKLRKIAGGDTYTIIYLKMLLIAMKQECKVYFDGIEKDFFEELALDLDEDTENVKVTCQFLLAQGLMTTTDNVEYELVACQTMVGKETAAAERMRRMRSKKSVTLLHDSYTPVTDSYKALHREEKRREDIDKSREEREKKVDFATTETQASTFHPPTVEEVRSYCLERCNSIDAERFVDYYQSRDWMVGSSKMTDWKCTIRNWERSDKNRQTEAKKPVIKKTAFSNFTERKRTPEEWENLERLLL